MKALNLIRVVAHTSCSGELINTHFYICTDPWSVLRYGSIRVDTRLVVMSIPYTSTLFVSRVRL